MLVDQIFPTRESVSVHDVVQTMESAPTRVRPFADEVVDFLNATSKELTKRARTHAALAPLAFFMRKAALKHLEKKAHQALPDDSLFVPQGVVFHIPPTNVDTLFLYTLTLSLLAGNKNIVRISRNSGPDTFLVLELLFDQLRQYPHIAELATFVQFGHEQEVMDALSQACDLRMIWGGDATIASVQRSPLPPRAKDLGFPDRVSLSAVSVDAWNATDDSTKSTVIQSFYNDIFWFDQMACSSPQSLILVGGSDADYVRAKTDIEARLSDFAMAKYDLPEGQAINKMVAAVRAVAAGAKSIDWVSNHSVAVDGFPLAVLEDIRPGGGFLGMVHMATIHDLGPWVTRKTQTLSVFGFERDELTEFVRHLNGHGIDRIVPIGSALDFSDVWDGKNLLLELMKLVRIEA